MADRVEGVDYRQRAIHHAWALRAVLQPRDPDPDSMVGVMLAEARETLRAANAEGMFPHKALPSLFGGDQDREYVPTPAAAAEALERR